MKKQVKTIALCSSASFYRELLNVEKQLKALGYKVKVPKTARIMAKANNFNDDDYKTWRRNSKDYKKKQSLMKGHFQKIAKSDAILVVNLKKNNVDGYIGGNVLLEIGLAFHLKKKIYILNAVASNHFLYEEIMGLQPTFLNGNLQKLLSKAV